MMGISNDAGWPDSSDCWKILTIDQDRSTHLMADEMMKDVEFKNKSFKIFNAYSSHEALDILSQNKDIALVIMDPFNGDNRQGLKLIDRMREVMGNSTARIIIITDIISNELKKEAVLNYDICGYKEKKTVLGENFSTVVILAIKCYEDIVHINNNKKAIEQIALSSKDLIQIDSVTEFMKSIFCDLNAIINLCKEDPECHIDGLSAIKSLDKNNFLVVAGFGKYEDNIGNYVKDSLPQEDIEKIKKVCKADDQNLLKDRYISCYRSSTGIEGIVFIEIKGSTDHIDIELLDVFHKNISAAFESLCLNREIEETQKEVLYRLGEITEARSEETGNHVKRVSLFSKILAERYGLSKKDVNLITMAAPIHDVGKVAIPDSILMKPGRLSSEEFEIVKTHTTIGYNLLKSSKREVLKSAAIIAHEHHERYDGEGYPRGLKGEEIHIYGRIVCIADVFDALGSPRVYKKAWVMDDILNHFRQERGKHFDPDLVDILFDNLDEFINIKEKYFDKNTKVIGKASDNYSER